MGTVAACIVLTSGFSVGGAFAAGSDAGVPGVCGPEVVRDVQRQSVALSARQRAERLEAVLGRCAGTLSVAARGEALLVIASSHQENRDDVACLDAARRAGALTGLGDEARGWAAYYVGVCGGPCGVNDRRCADGVAQRKKEATPLPTADKTQRSQPVSCTFAQARKTIQRLDRAGFHGTALTFVAAFLDKCGGKLPAPQRSSLLVDAALVHFHAGSDDKCLESLEQSVRADPSAQGRSTMFNRALCGQTCTASPASCKSAAAARRQALATRRQRQAPQTVVAKNCSENPTKYVLAWDLKTVRAHDAPFSGGVGTPVLASDVAWAGDLNGDGRGDLVLGSAGKRAVFTVYLGCAAPHAFYQAMIDRDGDAAVVRDDNGDGRPDICIFQSPEAEKPSTREDYLLRCWSLKPDGRYDELKPVDGR